MSSLSEFLDLDEALRLLLDAARASIDDPPWRLLRGRGKLLAAVGTTVDSAASVHPTSQIANSHIAAGAKIYEQVSIRDSYIGPGVVVGHSSEVARSIVLSDCSIPRFDYVGGSLLGQRVRLGGCVALATRRWDDDVIRPEASEETGSPRKLGSIVGADTIIGFGVHINPGCLVGRGALIGAHVDLTGDVPANTLVSVVQRQQISRLRRIAQRTDEVGETRREVSQ